MTETCAVCGLPHNHYLTCAVARRLAEQAAEPAEPTLCPDCGHEHFPAYGGICIGCPCGRRW